MAQIPTADTLPQTDAQPSISPVTYPRQFGRPNAVGEAVAQVGAGLMQAATQKKDQEDAFNYAQGQSAYLTGNVDLKTQIQSDPNNWKDADQRYTEGLTDLQQTVAQSIKNPKYQRQFAMESAANQAQGLAQIKAWQRGRQIDDGRASIDNTTQANLTAAWADPSSAPQIIAAHQTMLDGAAGSGIISDQESVNQQRSFTTRLAVGRIASMSDADQVAILGKSLPQRMGGTVAAPNIKAALLGQESGDNDNAPTSVTGAVGPGQMEPGTFAQFGPKGGDIHNAADNRLASSNYIDHLSALPNVQGDPARIAVGYFSGEGNISAPGSAAPYITDKLSPTGIPGKTKSTSSYVKDVMGRLGPPGAPGAADSTEQPSVKTGTVADFLDVPTRVTMLREAQARLRADGAAGVQAYASHARDTISYLQNGGDPSKVTTTPADVAANVPNEEGAGLADELSHALDYNRAQEEIKTATPQRVGEILSGHGITPAGDITAGPTDFRATAATGVALFKAAQERQQAIFGDGKSPGDPANYAIGAMSDVGSAFAAAQKSGKPEDFDGYVKRLNGAYDTLGVPPNLRSVLPLQAARSSVYSIANAAPQDAVARLDALKNESGRWWPAVNRDLVQAGLPAAYQAVGVAAPRDVMVSALQYEATARSENGKALADQLKGAATSDNKPVLETIDKTLAADPGLDSLQRSFGSSGTVGVDFYGGLRDAVRTTAMYLYAKGGGTLSAQDAVTKAASTITSQFDFVQQGTQTPVRLPKGYTADFQGATQHVLSGLKPSDIRATEPDVDEAGAPVKVGEGQHQEFAAQAAQNAYWITVPGADGAGAVRALYPQSGRPVMLSTGKPLDIPFAKMKYYAGLSAKKTAALPPEITGGPTVEELAAQGK